MSLVVTSIAACTAVGETAAFTAASIRARVARFHEHPFYDAATEAPEWQDLEPIAVASVPGVDLDIDGMERLLVLAHRALAELAESGAFTRAGLARTALLCALPEMDRAVVSWGLPTFASDVVSRTGLAFGQVEQVSSGHAGMFELVLRAQKLLSQSAYDRAVILGVDSYLSFDRLRLRDRTYELKSARNADGFVPGEGASAFVVAPAARKDAGSAELARIEASAAAVEEAPSRRQDGPTTDRESTGGALTSCLRQVISGPVQWMLCDLNGQSYRSFEWGIARARLADTFEALSDLAHPADSYGDIGAATGGALLASVIGAFQRGYAPAGDAVLWTAAEGAPRSAIRVTAPR